MIEYIEEFEVRPEQDGQFELLFGAGGAWSRLFSRAAGYRGTTLLRDQQRPERFLVVDIWDSPALRQATLDAHQNDYHILREQLQQMSVIVRELGCFTIRGAATVRALPKSRYR